MITAREAFVRFPKIHNIHDSRFIDSFDVPPDTPFVVTEKIHGANFCLIVARDSHAFASRNQILDDDASFYGFQEAIRPLGKVIPEIQRFFWKGRSSVDADAFLIRGELFGANIQRGVDYGPKRRLVFFDVTVYSGGRHRMQPWSYTQTFLTVFGLPSVPVLARYLTLEDALAYDPNTDSRLGPRGIRGNTQEGVVIRPMFGVILNTHNEPLLLKHKTAAFLERKSDRSYKHRRPRTAVPADVQAVIESAEACITRNRMVNLASHQPALSPDDIGRVIREYTLDVLDDTTGYDVLPKTGKAMVRRAISGRCARIVRDYILSDPEPEPESGTGICPLCNGCGEGMYPGVDCYACSGSGETVIDDDI